MDAILEFFGITGIVDSISSIGSSLGAIKNTLVFYIDALFNFNPVIGVLFMLAIAVIFCFAILKLIKAVIPAA